MKVIKEKINFTQVSNHLLTDTNVSAKAKGIYCYLYSKPDDWDFAFNRIAKDFADWEKSIRAGLKELEATGYLTRKKLSNGKCDYFIYQKPNTQKDQKATSQKGYQPKGLLDKIGTISNTELNTNTNNINNTNITNVIETKVSVQQEYWKPDINKVIETVKKEIVSNNIMYKAWKYERQRATNILTGKDFGEAARNNNMSRGEFCMNIIKLSTASDFWHGKIFNCETLYKYYAQVFNEAKKEHANALKEWPGIVEI